MFNSRPSLATSARTSRWRRVSTSLETAALVLLCTSTRPRYEDQIGLKQIMWGSDFPHPEGTWPNTAQYYVDTFKGFDADAGRQILGENAIQFYGLDGDYLNSLAADIGPSTSIFNG